MKRQEIPRLNLEALIEYSTLGKKTTITPLWSLAKVTELNAQTFCATHSTYNDRKKKNGMSFL